MSRALKGAIWSGLVFPGMGQIVLKHYKRGVAIILTVIISMVVIIVSAANQAISVLEKIDREGGIITAETLSDAATQAATGMDNFTIQFFVLLILVCWIVGTIDAYRIGRKIEIGYK